jgi:hypothetical protein
MRDIDQILFKRPKGAPEWMHTVFHDNGTVYVPAAVLGNGEESTVLRASYDGIKCIIKNEHVYVPTDWASREFTDARELIDGVVSNIKRRI